MWVVGAGGSSVVRKVRNNVIATGSGTNLIALDSKAAWVAARGTTAVTRLDLATLGGAPEPVTGSIAAYGTAFSRLWVASTDGHVTVLDGDGHRDALPAPTVAPGTVGVAPSNGVWFVSSDGTLNRIDPRTDIPAVTASGHYVEHAVPRRTSAAAPPRSAPGRTQTRSGCSAPGRSH